MQTSLPYARADVPVMAALHPVNAMILFVLAVVVAVRGRRLVTASTAT